MRNNNVPLVRLECQHTTPSRIARRLEYILSMTKADRKRQLRFAFALNEWSTEKALTLWKRSALSAPCPFGMISGIRFSFVTASLSLWLLLLCMIDKQCAFNLKECFRTGLLPESGSVFYSILKLTVQNHILFCNCKEKFRTNIIHHILNLTLL